MKQPALLLWALVLSSAAFADGLPQGTARPANLPIMSISPTGFDITLPGGGTVTRTLTVSNSGAGPLDFEISISPAGTSHPIIRGGKPPGSRQEEASPYRETVWGTVLRSPWDLLLSLDLGSITGVGGNAGAETDGSNFYCTRPASNLLYRIDPGGNLLEEFSIPGVSGLRDLAFDGNYMYGGSAGNTIYRMDFDSKTLIGTIPSPVAVRHIAYDAGEDGFWVGNWNSDIVLLSRDGAVLAAIPAAIHNLSGIAGSAYDGWTAGGPYLWIFDQGAGPGTPQLLRQFHLPTLSPTAFAYDVAQDFPGASGLAGGLFTDDHIYPGKAVIGGILQAAVDYLFVYELTPLNPPGWLTADPLSGMVPAGSSQDVTLTIDPAGLLPGMHQAYVIVSGNDPLNPADSALVNLTIPAVSYIYALPDPLIFPPGFLPDTLILTIYNESNLPVTVGDIASSNSVFIPLQTAFSMPPFSSSALEVVFVPGPAGLETGILSIFTNNPAFQQVDVTVQGEALDPPAIAVDPGEVIESLYQPGDSIDVPIQLGNTGGAVLEWSAGTNISQPPAGHAGIAVNHAEQFPFMILVGDTSGALSPGEIGGITLRLFAAPQDTVLYGEVWIATNVPGQPLVTIPVTLQVTVGIAEGEKRPTRYALNRNYPNPFNPGTTISYQVPEAAEVRLAIYNLLGQKVRTLIAARKPAGRYQMQWDGRDDNGRLLGSGVYFCRFSAGEYVQVRKTLLVK